MDTLDFLDGATAPELTTPAITEAPAEAVSAQPEPSEGPARGPDGKFIAQAPAETPAEPAQALAPEPASVAPPAPETAHAPITALLDEREKRQAAERKAQEYQQRLAQYERQQQPQAVPDPYEDPEGFASYQQAQLDQRIYATNLQWSRRIAEVQHTPEVVGQAHEWGVTRCNEDPFFNQKVQTSPDPYGFVIAEWKREQLLNGVQPDEFEQFRAWKASQGAPQPAPALVPTPQPSPPPRSMASLPSAGGSQPGAAPSYPGAAFDSIFRK